MAPTRAPAEKPSVASTTVPATSPPGTNGSSGFIWYCPRDCSRSGNDTAAARTSITTPAPGDMKWLGSGSGRSVSSSASGPSSAEIWKARIAAEPYAQNGVGGAGRATPRVIVARMSTVQLESVRHCIGGRQTPGASTRTAPVYDPATGHEQRHVLLAEPEDVDAAVQAAKQAFQTWREVSVVRRARIMFAFRELVDRHKDELARIIASEHGKTVEDAKGEVIRGMEVVEFACGIAELLKGQFSEQVSSDIDLHSF